MIITALKIIGIILLVILCIIVLLLCLVLFVPVRYRFSGKYDEALNADVVVSWPVLLLKVLLYVKDNKVEYVIRLFGGVVLTNTKAKRSFLGRKLFPEDFDEKEAHEAKTEKRAEKETPSKEQEKSHEKSTSFVTEFNGLEHKELGLETIDELSDSAKEIPETEPLKIEHEKTKEKRSIFDKISVFIKKIQKKWQNLLKQLKKINKKKDALLQVYHSKRFEIMKKDILLYIKELFSIIKPDHLEGELYFGFDDPALTGEVLGIMATALPLYDEFLSVYPDFEGPCLKGNIKGKGKIFLFLFIKLVIKVILNKNLIKVTKKVQTILEA